MITNIVTYEVQVMLVQNEFKLFFCKINKKQNFQPLILGCYHAVYLILTIIWRFSV